jgi:hypothetical protein
MHYNVPDFANDPDQSFSLPNYIPYCVCFLGAHGALRLQSLKELCEQLLVICNLRVLYGLFS